MYLGIDTSSATCSIAIMDKDGVVVASLNMQAGLTHSEQLIPYIQETLLWTKVKKSEIQGIVVVTGPGSFTGIRIGIGTAKALSYAWKIPIVGINSMDILAHHFKYANGNRISVIIDAQKKQVYERQYEVLNNIVLPITDTRVVTCEELLNELYKISQPVFLTGDGISVLAKYRKAQDIILPDHIKLCDGFYAIPHVVYGLELALPIFLQNTPPHPMEVQPYYIRKSEAEVQWEAKHKEETNHPSYLEPTVEVRETVNEL